MFKSKYLATFLSASGERFISELNEALHKAKETSTPEEFEKIKRSVGEVIGTLEVSMLWPLYRDHPELEPKNLRGSNDGMPR